MWYSSKLFNLFHVAKESVDALRVELSTIKAERDHLIRTLATTEANFRWLASRVNSLEVERASLMEKAYGIKIAVPEISRPSPSFNGLDLNHAIFEDLGDES